MPRVTIGVPVYNGDRFLAETLDCLLVQTFTDWELIISDNASTDGTAEICQRYVARDPRIRYFRNPTNLGSTRNFNRVLELASGPYFKLANADDLCAPQLVEQCVEVLSRHSEAVLCYGRTTLIDERSHAIRPYDDDLDLRQPRAADRFWQAIQRTRLVNVLQGVMRTDVLRRTGRLGPYVGSDVVLVAELALYGEFHELRDHLFSRRFHDTAFSSLTTAQSRQEFVDPQQKGRISFYTWRHHLEYQAAVWRSPLSFPEKVRLTGSLLHLSVSNRHHLLGELSDALAVKLRR
jgi:glycosyltransferase involved in cell wall biosynthesis